MSQIKSKKPPARSGLSAVLEGQYPLTLINRVIIFALIFLTAAAFWRVLYCGFIYFDTEQYVTSNFMIQRGLSWQTIKWAFTSMETSDWQPLIWISFILDNYVAGLNATVFHFMNLLWHVLNGVLVFYIFQKMTRDIWRSALLALFFAVHPLRVESVAWIAERKDVLSGFFWWLTIWAYVSWTQNKQKSGYAASVLFYFLAVLSKPVVVTLPVILLILDFWPLGRFISKDRLPALVIEKAPFFALSFFCAYMTLYAAIHTNQIISAESITFFKRFSNAIISYWAYIGKTFWPVDLAIFYPFPHPLANSAGIVFFAVTGLAAITFLAWIERLKRPYFLAGWIWYLIVLFPMMGFLRVSHQAMADRYTYFPHIGLGVAVLWGVGGIAKKFRKQTLAAVAAILYFLLTGLTWRQINYWRSPISLNQHADQVVPGNYMAWTNLGYAYFKAGKNDKALQYLDRVKPEHPAYYRAGITKARILISRRQYAQSEELLKIVIEHYPQGATAHFLLGISYVSQKKNQNAAASFLEAMRYKKTRFVAIKAMARLLIDTGELNKAEELLKEPLSIHPDDGFSNFLMGLLNQYRGNLDMAMTYYEKAALGNPRSQKALNRLTLLLINRGELDAAESLTRKVMEANPQEEQVKINMANVLMAKGEAVSAAELMRNVLVVNPGSEPAKQLLRDAEQLKESQKSGDGKSGMLPGAGLNISSPEELRDLIGILRSSGNKK